jgi:hypothetical protein
VGRLGGKVGWAGWMDRLGRNKWWVGSFFCVYIIRSLEGKTIKTEGQEDKRTEGQGSNQKQQHKEHKQTGRKNRLGGHWAGWEGRLGGQVLGRASLENKLGGQVGWAVFF